MRSKQIPQYRLTPLQTDKRHFDDIVVGSGLSALATVQGLVSRDRRVLVIAGTAHSSLRHYGFAPSVPCANRGAGGLGQYWHGVIPLNISARNGYDLKAFGQYLSRFYPGLAGTDLSKDRLFVPWTPIRPNLHFANLMRQNPSVEMFNQTATRLLPDAGGVDVQTDQAMFRAQTVWIATGTLDTPTLLAPLVGAADNATVSDHVIGYVGMLRRSSDITARLRAVRRNREGVFFPAFYNADRSVLYTIRPARFDFATLDEGIEKRAVFGLPTSRAIAGIMGRLSPGLVAEALYNKAGIGRSARHYSVYFQAVAKDAYALDADGQILTQDTKALDAATRHARETAPFERLTLSQRPELLIPGIHLHGSLSKQQTDILSNDSALCAQIRVVDPSTLKDIGPEHHSFRMMFDAYQQAEQGA